ncbi:MAG: aminomethyl-transferring glycine dehydrogenase subunit GcvPA [Candidatus Dadabacteria bacterium]|nr:MAG: aminomethyl-transferring glycine dehydrogenase subunit GcvPA [Candidatus Dadabacteria bacterium]
MLDTIGVEDVDALFTSIPESLRRQAAIDLPGIPDEADLVAYMRERAERNRTVLDAISFVGGGAYAYPPVAAALYAMSRGEFLTAYTPYQPEIAQGTLMAIFEFQTWVAELTGLDVANSSMYDGATALAEAILMGLRVRRKARTVAISAGLHPAVRAVVRRYLAGQQDLQLIELPLDASGRTDLDALPASDTPRIVALGYPNGYGVIEDISAVRTALDEQDFLVTHTPDPHAWLLLASPGSLGVDAAVADGQPFGVPVSFGGPSLGMFATRQAYVRQMPGRLCGRTTDAQGRTGYVLTLSTREQHIRREKATSNICTNQGVIALVATVTMNVLGPAGLRERALAAARNARRLERILVDAGHTRRFDGTFFNEFVIDPSRPDLWSSLINAGIQLGVPLSKYLPGDDGLLVAATSWLDDSAFDRLSQECAR